MPTFDRLALFTRVYRKLTPEHQARFRVAVMKLVTAVKASPPGLPGEPLVKASFAPGMRVILGGLLDIM
jgi:hypothetical protein